MSQNIFLYASFIACLFVNTIVPHNKGAISGHSCKLNFHTSYNQFYIGNKNFKGNTGSSAFWSKEAFNDRLAIDKDVIGVGIGSYGHVKADIVVLDKPVPNTNLAKYDHVVEGSLNLTSGLLEVTNCPDNKVELSVKLKPGIYNVRVYSSNLKNTVFDDEEGHDSYRIEIWPGTYAVRKVLKRHIYS